MGRQQLGLGLGSSWVQDGSHVVPTCGVRMRGRARVGVSQVRVLGMPWWHGMRLARGQAEGELCSPSLGRPWEGVWC